MTKDEALRLALDALENLGNHDHICPQWPTYAEPENYPKCNCGYDQAITAIKEALAESEPNYKKALEVWLDKTEWVQETVKPHELGMHRADVLKQRIEEASPQPEQLREENERLHVENRRLIDRIETIGVPVGIGGFATTTTSQPDWIERERAVGYREGHRAALAQRTWVELTEKEVNKIIGSDRYSELLKAVVQTVEAKLKEKNNG